MYQQTPSDQSKNYLQIMNHPRAHEFARIVEWSIQTEGFKESTPMKAVENTRVNLAVSA
jgi:hypothetical protein